jgi:hypothetical protein
MNMNNFIALTPNDIIIYNHIQSKIYKYFISYNKEYNFIIDDNLNENNNDKKYCKFFKFNICLCYRNKNNLNNYETVYKCPNNKRILYNLNNFNFLNPVSININNNKLFPIDIFTYYRQEYLPFIINEEFNKYKNNQIKIKIINKKKLSKLFNCLKYNLFKENTKKPLNNYLLIKSFNLLKYYNNNFHFLKYNFNVFKENTKKSLNKKIHISYNDNSYYNDLVDVFNNNPLNTSKTTGTQTEEEIKINYALLFAIVLNDYTNLIGDYNDLLISIIKH